MMKTIQYSIELLSDTETGSGLGSEAINDVVARNHMGKPVVRGTHLKGLFRDTLTRLAGQYEWCSLVADHCFGRGGTEGDDGICGKVHIGDAQIETDTKVRTITRTCLNELGVAAGGSLRTTEAVAAGTAFTACIMVSDEAPDIVMCALKLILLSLESIGGGRSRGSGACLISIEGESETPGNLLKQLHTMASKGIPELNLMRSCEQDYTSEPSGDAVCFRLVFEADEPVCCPEMPVVQQKNVIESGICIPSSAVLGIAITRLAQIDKGLAQAAFEDERTRAWSLMPCPGADAAQGAIPVRVALSHRMSKLPNDQDQYEFGDVAIEPYDWRTVAKGSPLKGSDGILIKSDSANRVQLWKSGAIPRILTSHSVHYQPGHNGDGIEKTRNLFTMESLAPMTYVGMITLPAKAADVFEKSLKDHAVISVGKTRSVRGSGRLRAERISSLEKTFDDWEKEVFVLQTPADFPDHWTDEEIRTHSAEEMLARLVKESGWGEVKRNVRQRGSIKITTQANYGVRFGWNRHASKQGVAKTNRLQARRVFLPGSVFVLEKQPDNLNELLIRGLGVQSGRIDSDRQRGFGAVLPHPGIATSPYTRKPEFERIDSVDEAGKIALNFFERSRSSGLSASQIAALANRIPAKGKEGALAYLQRQKSQRTSRIWERWSDVYEDLSTEIKKDPRRAARVLRVWQDLIIADRKDREENSDA
ncbi:MAG: hypothetical protein EOL87_07710 [Spartobacteria bacterium]|nr:hypothetical protein [Spartobacteria bacterium]